MSFNKAAFVQCLQPAITPLTLDAFGDVWLRQISVDEAAAIRAAAKGATGAEFGLRLVVATLAQEDGTPMLTLDDLPALRSAADAKMGKLVERVLEVNGYKAATDPNASR